MAGLSAYEIYVGLTRGRGPQSLTAAYDTAKHEADLEVDRTDRINALATKIQAGWEGTAGTAASGAARPLAVVSSVGAANLEITHRLLERQAYSFDTARSNVEPVAERPPETGIIDDLSPWETDTEKAVAQHQADSNHNIRVYRQYDQQSWDNESALPMDYSTLEDPGGEIVIRRPEEPPPSPREPGGGGGDVRTPPGGDDRRTPSAPPPGGDPTRPQWTDPTPPQQHDPRTPPSPPVRPPTTPTPPPGLPPFTPPGVPPYGPGIGRRPGGPGTGRGPGGPGTGRGPATGGPGTGGPGTGGPGPGGAGRGPGGAGPRAGGHGPGALGAGPNETGARAGAGSGDQHAQSRQGAAGQGRGGVGGVGGMGGARGQGGEDEEHTRASFLQEDDPEAIFGTDQVTAPPVIGE